MTSDDLYEVLELTPEASHAEIRRSYRRLVRLCHPDLHAGEEAAWRFRRVTGAYRVLADPEQRAVYDRLRLLAGEAGPGPGARVWVGTPPTEDGARSEASLHPAAPAMGERGVAATDTAVRGVVIAGTHGTVGRVGGAGGQAGPPPGVRGRPRRGGHVTATVVVDLAVAVSGGPVPVPDPAGETRMVRLPPGTADGRRLRIPGYGHPGSDGGPPGDLYLVVRVRPHPHFRCHGRDLHLDLPVTFAEAVAGARVRLPGLHGPGPLLEIPPGTRPGQEIRIVGAGLPSAGGPPGDLVVTVRVDVPRHLSAAARALVAELGRLLPSPRADAIVAGDDDHDG